MAIFNRQKNTTPETVQEEKALDNKTAQRSGFVSELRAFRNKASRPHDVLQNLRITEKSALLSEAGAYTFDIDPRYGKKDVAEAVKTIYKVTPVKVNIVSVPKQQTFSARTGRRGSSKAIKKAIVRLKKGEKIEFV